MAFKHGIVALALIASAVTPDSAQTLKAVQERGYLISGVSEGLDGFSTVDEKGQWTGLDVDFCRALAAAIFDDAAKVRFVPLSANNRFTGLETKKIDVLSRNSSWTMGRETGLGLMFAAVDYYDGQGFMVRKPLNIKSALELAGKPICTKSGTTTELNLADFARNNGVTYKVMALSSALGALKAYDSGLCQALTSDVSQLYAQRIKLTTPSDHIILPEIISKEALGPAVRNDDV